MRGAKHQLFHRLVESRIARGADVRFGRLARDERALRGAHRLQHRGVALPIAVNPDAEIDLAHLGIGAECRHQPQDRIGYHGGEMLEHMFSPQMGAAVGVRPGL